MPLPMCAFQFLLGKYWTQCYGVGFDVKEGI
jgi:hypothetical protein